ncbi:MAG: zinc-ribbon domain-containing protein [Planctomycetota bacterium]
MITSCTHCGAQYQLPDKMLGKQARCKACKRLFVIVPTETEVELPEPTGSTVAMEAVQEEEDGLEALASAASGSDFEPTPRSTPRSSSRARYREDDYDDEPRGRHRMAKGAKASMGLGITSCVITAAGVILMIIAMVNSKNQDLKVMLGVICIGLLAIGAVLSMMAIANGTGATKQIRKARHPLGGRSEASTGSLMGTIALGLVFVSAITIGIYLARTGGIKFEETIVQPAGLSLPLDAFR